VTHLPGLHETAIDLASLPEEAHADGDESDRDHDRGDLAPDGVDGGEILVENGTVIDRSRLRHRDGGSSDCETHGEPGLGEQVFHMSTFLRHSQTGGRQRFWMEDCPIAGTEQPLSVPGLCTILAVCELFSILPASALSLRL